jgi:membrane protease YdiL (CAAX protease family)
MRPGMRSPGPSADPNLPAMSDTAQDVPPWRLWAAPIALVAGFIVAEILTTIVFGIGSANGSSSSPAVEIIGSVVFDFGFIAAAVGVAFVMGGARPALFGFRRAPLWKAIAAVAAAAIVYYALTAVYASLFALHAKDNLPSSFGVRTSDWAAAGTAAFVCVVAPMCEETFFRGFLFGTLRKLPVTVAGRDLGPWMAAVIVGILFGLAHAGSANPEYLVPLGFLGFVLCLVRWRTQSLYPGMALHSANNSLALAVQLHWTTGDAAALMVGSWLVIALIVGPLGARNRALV